MIKKERELQDKYFIVQINGKAKTEVLYLLLVALRKVELGKVQKSDKNDYWAYERKLLRRELRKLQS